MVGLALLLSAELPALGFQLQMVELPLVERVHCSLRWKNGIEVVVVPLHPTAVKVLTMLHHDEVVFQEGADGFYHSVFGHPCGGGDGVVAGMAGVCFAILDQQEVGVHHERRRWKIQQEDFIGGVKNFPLPADKKSAAREHFSMINPTSCKSDRYFRAVPSDLWMTFATISGDRLVLLWEEWQHR